MNKIVSLVRTSVNL